MNNLLQKLKQLLDQNSYPLGVYDNKQIKDDSVPNLTGDQVELDVHSNDIEIRGFDEHSLEERLSPQTQHLNISGQYHQRNIAYTVSGNLNAHKILFCLPSLLETRESFAVLHAYFFNLKRSKLLAWILLGEVTPILCLITINIRRPYIFLIYIN